MDKGCWGTQLLQPGIPSQKEGLGAIREGFLEEEEPAWKQGGFGNAEGPEGGLNTDPFLGLSLLGTLASLPLGAPSWTTSPHPSFCRGRASAEAGLAWWGVARKFPEVVSSGQECGRRCKKMEVGTGVQHNHNLITLSEARRIMAPSKAGIGGGGGTMLEP